MYLCLSSSGVDGASLYCSEVLPSSSPPAAPAPAPVASVHNHHNHHVDNGKAVGLGPTGASRLLGLSGSGGPSSSSSSSHNNSDQVQYAIIITDPGKHNGTSITANHNTTQHHNNVLLTTLVQQHQLQQQKQQHQQQQQQQQPFPQQQLAPQKQQVEYLQHKLREQQQLDVREQAQVVQKVFQPVNGSSTQHRLGHVTEKTNNLLTNQQKHSPVTQPTIVQINDAQKYINGKHLTPNLNILTNGSKLPAFVDGAGNVVLLNLKDKHLSIDNNNINNNNNKNTNNNNNFVASEVKPLPLTETNVLNHTALLSDRNHQTVPNGRHVSTVISNDSVASTTVLQDKLLAPGNSADDAGNPTGWPFSVRRGSSSSTQSLPGADDPSSTPTPAADPCDLRLSGLTSEGMHSGRTGSGAPPPPPAAPPASHHQVPPPPSASVIHSVLSASPSSQHTTAMLSAGQPAHPSGLFRGGPADKLSPSQRLSGASGSSYLPSPSQYSSIYGVHSSSHSPHSPHTQASSSLHQPYNSFYSQQFAASQHAAGHSVGHSFSASPLASPLLPTSSASGPYQQFESYSQMLASMGSHVQHRAALTTDHR